MNDLFPLEILLLLLFVKWKTRIATVLSSAFPVAPESLNVYVAYGSFCIPFLLLYSKPLFSELVIDGFFMYLFLLGDDWEHEEIFTDDDETVTVDPEEREDLAPEIPAPPEIKQVCYN